MTNGNNEIIKKLRDVIQNGGNIDVNTRDVLLFSAIIDIYDQYEITRNDTKSLRDEMRKEFIAVRKEMEPALNFAKAGVWVVGAFGVSFVGLVFMMLTGQVELIFK